MEGIKLNLEEPQDSTSPLIRFKAVLKEYKVDAREATEDRRASTSVVFDFVDVVVIESREPYPFPIATLRIPYSERNETRWAAFTSSLRKILPPEVRSSDGLDALVGKNQEWHWTAAKLRQPLRDDEGNDIMENGKQKWGVRDADSWQILNCEGFGGAEEGSIMDAIVEYADGKTDKDLYQWVFTSQELKRYSDYTDAVEAVASRQLIGLLEKQGRLKTEADGTLRKVG